MEPFYTLFSGHTFGFKIQSLSVFLLVAMFLILMPLLVGIFYTQANEGRLLIHVRKGWQLMFVMILLSIAVSLVDMGVGFENWLLMLPFIAMFHGYGYKASTVKIYPLFLFWASVILIISNYILK
ncbi:MAG: hypothetical protein E6Q95_01440 [Chitinophagaceae bacterium]|nr:MAG: hypothetical protein E6Q95_01440 [Chitinophagaceae bacterium]